MTVLQCDTCVSWFHKGKAPAVDLMDHRSTIGDRSFPVAATRSWSTLPQHFRNAFSLSIFHRELKTILFWSSVPDAI